VNGRAGHFPPVFPPRRVYLPRDFDQNRDDVMKLKLLFAATVAFAAFPAHAQDNGDSRGTFTGPRIQAQVGWDRTGINLQDTRNFGGRGDFGAGSEQDNEVSYGGEVGFDLDVGGFVVGAYAGADFSNADEDFDFSTATPTAPSVPRLTLEASRNLYAGARIGVVAAPNILIYGKGGFSRARLEDQRSNGTGTIIYPTDEDDFDGYHFGGGIELALGRMLYVRADYTHTRYENMDLPTQTNPAQTLQLHFNRNQVTGAIGIRF
jgi:outer membrane immunogenic protein